MLKSTISIVTILFFATSFVSECAAQQPLYDGWLVLPVPTNAVVYTNGYRTRSMGSVRRYEPTRFDLVAKRLGSTLISRGG